MTSTKIDTLGKVLGALQIIIAFFNFDPSSINQIVVSVFLFFGGWILITGDIESKYVRTANRIIGRLLLVAAVAFIIKLVIYG